MNQKAFQASWVTIKDAASGNAMLSKQENILVKWAGVQHAAVRE